MDMIVELQVISANLKLFTERHWPYIFATLIQYW